MKNSSSTAHTPRVLVIGAGFSGTVLAVQLLRQTTGPLAVQLLDEPARVGRGLAYGTQDPAHLLNVPAGNMSALADDAGHFLRHARCPAGAFLPRQAYGGYLQALLAETEAAAAALPGGPRLERVAGRAVAIEPPEEPADGRAVGQPATVQLADGRRLQAERLVLATGHAPAAQPLSAAQQAALGQAWIADPWQRPPAEAAPRDGHVLLIGGGLTALDLLLSLAGAGHRGPITILSRRGLAPQPHREHPSRPAAPDAGALLARMGPTLRGQLRTLRRHVAQAMAEGDDWRDWIAALRPHTPAWWQGLPAADRGRFLRHLQVHWDTLRHRAAPEAQATAERLAATGQLRRHAGRIVDVQARRDGPAEVHWQSRRGERHSARVDLVVNCTGPSSRLTPQGTPLLAALAAAGHAAPDAHALGLQVGPGYGLLDAAGQEQPWLRYLGPLLRARDWEATAVPELRVHAAALARTLLAEFATR